MKNLKTILMAAALVLATSGAVMAEGGGIGGGIGISVPSPNFPNIPDEINGENIRIFWTCFFSKDCRVRDLPRDLNEARENGTLDAILADLGLDQ